jgi:site-specific DNA recombinase
VIHTASMLIVCLLYFRVSTEDQAKTGYSLPEQKALCHTKARELCKSIESEQGVKVDLQTVEFEDTLGGDVIERPVLEQMREYVRRQRPAYFICLDPDRFSRSLKWQLLLADEIEDQGTRLVFVQQDYNPEDMMSRAFFQFRGLMSELEKAKIRERTVRGSLGKLKSGKLAHWAQTYGYQYNKEASNLDVVPEEAEWVRRIFEWTAERWLPSEIRDHLNTMGIPPRRGGVWYTSTIRSMLRNRTYIGETVCNRLDTAGISQLRQLPKHLRKKTLTPKVRPEKDWIVVRVPAIVTHELFLRAHQTFRAQKRQAKRGAGMLSGICRCGLCGGAIHYIQHKPNYYNLRCINRYGSSRDMSPTPDNCKLPHVGAKIAERWVWGKIIEVLLNPEALIADQVNQQDSKKAGKSVKRAEAELTTLESRLSQKRKEQSVVLSQIAKGNVDEQVGDQVMAELNREIDAIRKSSAQLQSQIEAFAEIAASPANLRAHFRDVRSKIAEDEAMFLQKMANLNEHGRQQVVRWLVREVRVFPGRRFEIDFVLPPS